jgi:protocatechuate 4,5-dioxygenase beta chain
MPLQLGLASSHAPSMFVPPDRWPEVHRALTPGVPQPPEAEQETTEVVEKYVTRIKDAFGVLRSVLEAYRPDALIIVGDDQTEVFSKACTPSLALFAADEVSGTTSISWIGERRDQNHIRLKCHKELGAVILEGLIQRGFDPANIEELTPLARPEGGLGHAFTRPAKALGLHESEIPIVIVFLNAYSPPLPTAARCFEIGVAIREILSSRAERVAILASGGLSHNPMGPRAGWIDEPLDRWLLDTIAAGESHRLRQLFTFDSATLRGGTGEIRSWITVAGAFSGERARVVDYIPAYTSTVGLGFAYWQPESAAASKG